MVAIESSAIPEIVARTPVITDSLQVTVSTIRIASDYYDTVVFDDSPEKLHTGKQVGGFVIDQSSKRSSDRETAMEQHREALIAIRAGQFTSPDGPLCTCGHGQDRHYTDATMGEAPRLGCYDCPANPHQFVLAGGAR